MPSLAGIVADFPGKRILVIGDVILDQYIWGDVERISPEAPVPIVKVVKETYRLGGAANSAANICNLGGKISIVSAVGNDENGDRLCGMLSDIGAEIKGIARNDSRSTVVKTRVIAHHQHVVRIDREMNDQIDGSVRGEIIAHAEEVIPNVDAVLISDYDKGIIGKSVLDKVISCAKKYNRLVVVDPKMRNFWHYAGATLVTPSKKEASAAVNMVIRTEEDVFAAGRSILGRLGLQGLLITRGEEGMTLFQTNGISRDGIDATHIPAVARDVFDVTGAGDTVAAVITLCLASGADLLRAARVANFAAGVVVGKVGTACATTEELLSVIRRYERENS